MWILIWLLAQSPHSATCNSTIFGQDGDHLAGGDALYLGRPVNATDLGIAHRWLPLGSLVLLELHGQQVVATVIDRGPYGRTDAKGNWYNGAAEARARKFRHKSRYRGCVDITPAAAAALGHDGWERVTIYWIPRWRVRKTRPTS